MQECLCYRRAFYQSVTFDVDMKAVRLLASSVHPQAFVPLLVMRSVPPPGVAASAAAVVAAAVAAAAPDEAVDTP